MISQRPGSAAQESAVSEAAARAHPAKPFAPDNPAVATQCTCRATAGPTQSVPGLVAVIPDYPLTKRQLAVIVNHGVILALI